MPSTIRELMLEAIGVSAEEELAYRVLIAHPQATRDELAGHTQLGTTRLRKALTGLEAKGLVSRSPRAGHAVVPTPPDIAIEAMIGVRHEELERARSFGRMLAEEFRRVRARDDHVELVELIEGREVIGRRFEQLQQGARREVMILDQPPYHVGMVNHTEFDMLARGVAYRTLYDRRALEEPGLVDHLEQYVAAGEEARVLDGVPLKLALVDRSLALIPLAVDQPGEDAVLVRSSALLSGLALLFEMLWERAIPLQLDIAEEADGGLSADDQRVLALLAAGLKDEAIARQLGMGLRTVRRRVAGLMEAVDAGNRFQLGLQAGRRGWL